MRSMTRKLRGVRTVGDFYELICAKLDVSPLQSPVTSKELPVITQSEKTFLFLARYHIYLLRQTRCHGPRKVCGIAWSLSL